MLFGDADTGGSDVVTPLSYQPGPSGATFDLTSVGTVRSRQFGRHSALNAAAVVAAIRAADLGASAEDLAPALAAFRGIRQRFELAGMTAHRVPVYNDYAHNVEKIAAAIATAREAAGTPLVAFFQPHGYGPLGFMRDELRDSLGTSLQEGDRFVLLPVYYAGGTTSFRPTSAEVARGFASHGLPVTSLDDREAAAEIVRTSSQAACGPRPRRPRTPPRFCGATVCAIMTPVCRMER